MGKKLIFVDIDGTLTPAGSNTPPDSALKAIRAAQAKGHLVLLCTGRNPDMLAPLLQYDFDGLVSCSGGYVKVGEDLIYDHPMPRKDQDLALESLHKNGVFCTIEAVEGSWGDSNLAAFLQDQPEGNSEIERWRKALAGNLGIRPMEEYTGVPVYKIVIMCTAMEQLEEARSLLEEDYHFVLQEVPAHGCINGEIVSRAFDKGQGIRRICEHLGISIEDTVGFGDSMNDLEMIQTVGTSVCMENGAKALKEISDLVVPSVQDDGLAFGFEQLGLV